MKLRAKADSKLQQKVSGILGYLSKHVVEQACLYLVILKKC